MRPRKLSPEEEAAIIDWYSQYRRALEDLKKLGNVPKQAKQYGVSIRRIHVIAKRDQYNLMRKAREVGVRLTRDQTLFALSQRENVQTLPTLTNVSDISAHDSRATKTRTAQGLPKVGRSR